MIVRAPGVGMGVSRYPRPVREVGVLPMLDAGLDAPRRIKSVWIVPLRTGLLRLVVPGLGVGVMIDCCC
jgi:hypothetical protein